MCLELVLELNLEPFADRQLGIVSAPLWDSETSTFAGLLTTSDYINVIQYYWQNPDALARVDQFKLNSLRGMALHCCIHRFFLPLFEKRKSEQTKIPSDFRLQRLKRPSA